MIPENLQEMLNKAYGLLQEAEKAVDHYDDKGKVRIARGYVALAKAHAKIENLYNQEDSNHHLDI